MLEIKYRPISAVTLVHPLEYQLTLAVQKDGMFDHITRSIGGLSLQLKSLPQMMLTAYPVTQYTYPRLYNIYQRVMERLDCTETIPLFVDFGYELKAYTHGSTKNGYVILVNSSCLEELNDGELEALLGREIGHIMNGHIYYQEMLSSLRLLTDKLSLAGEAMNKKISSFFSKWIVASEYTADRAGLMACTSFETFASLMMKQMGIEPNPANIKQILTQKIDPMPEKMGINYMIMAEAFSTIGMKARVQEVDKWVNSHDFREKYPFIHYMAKGYVRRPAQNETERILILLHQRASNGNVLAQERLAQDYLSGKETLPVAYEPCLALLYHASLLGSGTAMYFYYKALVKEIGELKATDRLKNQLLLASMSRSDIAQKAGQTIPNQEKLTILPALMTAYVRKRQNQLHFLANTDHIGEPLTHDNAEMALDAFWMTSDDKIYALQMGENRGMHYGIAISEKGIYGRLQEKRYPFMVPWSEFVRKPLEIVNDGVHNFVACGATKLAAWDGSIIAGSINELLIGLQKKCGIR